MGKEIKMNQGQQQQQIRLNPSDLTDVLCDKCDGQTFVPAFMFKKLSAILSPNGKDSLIPLQVYACTACGHINEGFLPKEHPNAE
jgi:hypothetical protein